ncbi:type II toxin-antitoxin system RelE family toxin [Streptomyces avicenniae]|uniref:type II toxin-antitoxin system RelE family toxin n=1 Tax=Streptomyces avicenniae TaxID=500153 RepID=UPI00069C7987|nr:type II toxin-antitoxin system RelE/ParE family toxin [Streptomyces avicenniae]
MSAVQWADPAKRSFARFQKDDPRGADLLLDSINLLAKNPQPAGAHSYGGDEFRIHVGLYRVLYRIVSRNPLILAVEHIGRANTA